MSSPTDQQGLSTIDLWLAEADDASVPGLDTTVDFTASGNDGARQPHELFPSTPEGTFGGGLLYFLKRMQTRNFVVLFIFSGWTFCVAEILDGPRK